MTEKEKMLAGMVYSAVDEQLLEELNAAKEVIHKYNSLSPADAAGRLEILKNLLKVYADINNKTYDIKRQVDESYKKRLSWQVVFSPTLPKWNYLIKPIN